MGARNVALVYTRWPQLDDRPFRLLAYMALVSLDSEREDQPARRFWGGREVLAEVALGRVLPMEPAAGDGDEDAAAARRDRSNAFKAVQSALAVLTREGAVERLREGRVGQRSEYVLHLEKGSPRRTPPQVEGYAQHPPQGYAQHPPQGYAQRAGGVRPDDSEGYAQTTPKEDGGTTGLPRGGHHLPSSPHRDSRLQSDQDACGHGQPGGADLLPSGVARCPLCRRSQSRSAVGVAS